MIGYMGMSPEALRALELSFRASTTALDAAETVTQLVSSSVLPTSAHTVSLTAVKDNFTSTTDLFSKTRLANMAVSNAVSQMRTQVNKHEIQENETAAQLNTVKRLS